MGIDFLHFGRKALFTAAAKYDEKAFNYSFSVGHVSREYVRQPARGCRLDGILLAADPGPATATAAAGRCGRLGTAVLLGLSQSATDLRRLRYWNAAGWFEEERWVICEIP